MNSDERTVSAIFARDHARRRLRNATIGAGIVGAAVAGVVMIELPAAAHSTTSSSSAGSANSSTGHSATSAGSGQSSSSSGSLGSSSAPSSSSGPAGATSGGS